MMAIPAAGVAMLIGGCIEIGFAVRTRNRRLPWRGEAVSAMAMFMYGILISSGPTTYGAFGWWIVAAAMVTGLALKYWDSRGRKKPHVISRLG